MNPRVRSWPWSLTRRMGCSCGHDSGSVRRDCCLLFSNLVAGHRKCCGHTRGMGFRFPVGRYGVGRSRSEIST